jgi:hypothetical protein
MQQPSSSASPYRRGAVPIGPFSAEPMDLMAVLCKRPDGSWRSGDEIRNGSRAWLTGALDAAGVTLGEHDHVMIELLAGDGWATVQVVAGWIARAHNNAQDRARVVAEENGRAPPQPDPEIAASSGLI